MTYDEFQSAMQDDVSRLLANNHENILNALISNLPKETTSITQEQLLMCQNTVNYSVQMSAKIVFYYLNQLGMLKLDNIELNQEPHLTLLKGGLYDSNK